MGINKIFKFILIFFTLHISAQMIPFANWTISSRAPSSLVLSHSDRNRSISVSWTAGSGNGGASGCKLQFYTGSGWSDITAATNLNCDANSTSASYNLNASGWKSNWNATQVRLVRKSDSSLMGVFAQTLSCSTTSGSSSSTPLIDEDCNGEWDNSTTGPATSVCRGKSPVAANGGEVPGAAYDCGTTDNTDNCTGKTVTGFSYFQCQEPYERFSDSSCLSSLGISQANSNELYSSSGSIPSLTNNGMDILNYSCQSFGPWWLKFSSGNYWNWGCYCYYTYSYNVTEYF